MYGIAHCLIDRDGRVIGCNLPIGNGPLLEQAPAMAQILRELVAGVPAEQLRTPRRSSARSDRYRARSRAGRGRRVAITAPSSVRTAVAVSHSILCLLRLFNDVHPICLRKATKKEDTLDRLAIGAPK
jgi:hypothetical protein